jgi:hypothetical protein
MIDLNLQAKLLAYKAYQIGRDATLRKCTEREARFTLMCISQLEKQGQSEEILRRRLFYTLINAEIHRTSDPVPDRMKAKEIGEELKKRGCVDPFELYMKIIKATTNTATAGNYGDITTRKNLLIQDSESFIDRFGHEIKIDKAAAAVNLSPGEIKRNDMILSLRLEEIARLHKLGP